MAGRLGDVRLRIDLGQLEATVAPMVDGAVQRAAIAATERARQNVASDGLIHTGKLMNTMRWQPINGGLFPRYAVGSPEEYVKYPEFGTRAHGPVKANVLRFKPKGGQAFVFTTWVRGVRPYGFMRRTLDQMRPTDFID